MKITMKLAYKQLQINRTRTFWTLAGIVLSTSLITAVCSFAASGHKLMMDLYGADYLQNSLSVTILIFPAALLSIIIIFVSVIVISNSFRVSAGERIAQFGILKSVGATKYQITTTVLNESVLLSAAGIPVGIIIGLCLAYAGALAANFFLADFNSLVDILLIEISLTVDFVIAWQALAAAAALSFVTVLLSSWLPARKAARITAIDSIRGTSEVNIMKMRVHTGSPIYKLFGFEGVLAAQNIKRSRRNFRASMISLTIGIILFINLSTLSRLGASVADSIYPDIDATVMADYSSLRNDTINEATGREEMTTIAPIDSRHISTIADQLRAYKDTPVFGTAYDNHTYQAIVPKESILPSMKEMEFFTVQKPEYEVSAEIIVVDDKNYASLCKKAGVTLGSNILINNYSYVSNGKENFITPFLLKEKSIQLIKGDGSLEEIQIDGELTQKNIPNELLAPNQKIIRLIVPRWEVANCTWTADPSDIEGFMAYAKELLDSQFPKPANLSYAELGFDTRVYELDDYINIMNLGISMAIFFLYGFVGLLSLIGLTNVISTMTANVRMRAREFAMLRSVGMTQKGVNHMLNLESLMCSAKSLIVGLPLATVLSYLISQPFRDVFPVPYHFPWLEILCCIAAVFLFTWITIRCSALQLRKRNMMETIRSGNGV